MHELPALSGGQCQRATLWVTVLVLGGYWFGNLPLIKEHFSLLIMAIIVLSLTPLLMTYARSKWR